jgi:dihydrofolate reductase
MSITLIACLDMDSGIGTDEGQLLFHLPKDLQHFKSTTSGKAVVMGRKTWESLPIKPLPKRKNYVLTRDVSFNPEGAIALGTVEEVLDLSKGREVFIIGGGELYEQFIDIADKMILTQVHSINFNATVHFPDFSAEHWKITSMKKHEADDNHPVSFTFATYERRSQELN